MNGPAWLKEVEPNVTTVRWTRDLELGTVTGATDHALAIRWDNSNAIEHYPLSSGALDYIEPFNPALPEPLLKL